LFVFIGCSSPKPPNIIIVAVGGLRADVEPSEETAEFLQGLFPRELTNLYTTSTTSIPSVASLLTGRVPSEIPICGQNTKSKSIPWCNSLPGNVPNLPEVLSLYGYKTALFVDGFPELRSIDWRFDNSVYMENGLSSNWSELGKQASTWWKQHDEPKLVVILSNDLGLELRTQMHSSYGVSLQKVANGDGKMLQANDPKRLQQIYQELADDTIQGAIQTFSFFQEEPVPIRILTGLYGIDLGEGSPYPDQPIPALSHRLIVERTIKVPLWTNINIPTSTSDQVLSLVDLFPTIAQISKVVPPASLPGQSWLIDNRTVSVAYSQFGDMRSLRSNESLLTFRGFVHGASTLEPVVSDKLLKEPRNPSHYFLHRVTSDPNQNFNLVDTEIETFNVMLDTLRSIEQQVRMPTDQQTEEQIKALRMGPTTGYW
jgi:arylsulfatase A-like enzyme